MVRTTRQNKKIVLRYEEVAQSLRDQIQTHTFQPGDRLPSFRALRQEHGVTQATIDKVYSLLENEGLIVRSQRSGVFVADPTVRPATGIIGFCNIGFTKSYFTSFWARVMEGVEEAAQEANVQILLLRTSVASGWDKVDGVLFNGFSGKTPATRLPPELPVASLFVAPPYVGPAQERQRAFAQTSVIRIDDRHAMYMATKHLLSLGHRRIAYLNNSYSDTRLFPHRYGGYQEALQEAGITPDKRWLRALSRPTPTIYFMSAGREAMSQWLQEDWDNIGCTALLTQNDDTAWGAIEALREAGKRVPDDVSVVGFDGTDTADICNPPLTTIEMPLQQMGRAALEVLLRHIDNRHLPAETCVLPTQLRMRSSTAAPRR